MSIKGTVDPFHFGGSETSLLRDGGEYVEAGWYCMDDDGRRIDGPYHSRQLCQLACNRINAA